MKDRPYVEALMKYERADEDGVMVLASRQAIDETVERLRSLEATLEFVERWAVYKRFKPAGGKSITAEEAISIIAYHPAVREITVRHSGNGEVDEVAYAKDLSDALHNLKDKLTVNKT